MAGGSRNGRTSKWGLVAAGMVAGALLVSPAGAHVGNSIAHLWGGPNHIKDKVQALGDARYMRFGWNSYLPPGKTQTGTILSRVETDGYLLDDASYQMPLDFTPTVVLVDNDGGTPLPAGCSGSVNDPRAAPGYLCIYAGFLTSGTSWDGTWDPSDGNVCGCRRGVVVYKLNSSGGYAEGAGAWAVTAPTAGAAFPGGKPTHSRNGQGTGA